MKIVVNDKRWREAIEVMEFKIIRSLEEHLGIGMGTTFLIVLIDEMKIGVNDKLERLRVAVEVMAFKINWSKKDYYEDKVR